LEIRRYELILEKIIEAAKDLPSETHPKGGNADFSDHWWNLYWNSHPKVKKAWEALPLERTFEKNQRAIMKKISLYYSEISDYSAKNVDYFIKELNNSGNIQDYYQDSAANQILGQEEKKIGDTYYIERNECM